MTPTIKEIQQRAAKACGVPIPIMLSYDRTRRVSRARQIAIYAARVATGASWNQLAESFKRDRKAMRQAVDVIDWFVWHDQEVKAKVQAVCSDWRRA